jgi:hypothetical protein
VFVIEFYIIGSEPSRGVHEYIVKDPNQVLPRYLVEFLFDPEIEQRAKDVSLHPDIFVPCNHEERDHRFNPVPFFF